MIPRFKPYLNSKEIRTAINFSMGNIGKFEKAFAEKFECKYGVIFPYGRSGLYSLFKVWQLEGSEIICPAYTCVVVPNAIVLSGNIPVFVDCETNSFNMSYGGIEKSITERTGAIIVTHLFGYPMDIDRVDRIVKNAEDRYGHKIYIVQDVAHSLGSRWNGRMVTGAGDATVYSLGISKTINSISGGMVTTNNHDFYKKIIEYKDVKFVRKGPVRSIEKFLFLCAMYVAFNNHVYSFTNLLERKGLLDEFVKYYNENEIYFPGDWNVCSNEIEARVGLVQLKKYDEVEKKKIAIAGFYNDNLRDLKDIVLPSLEKGATYSHYVCCTRQRDKLGEYMRKKGIQIGFIIEYSIPHMKAYEKYGGGNYENSLHYSRTVINLPNYPGLLEKDLRSICGALREYY